MLNGVSPGCGTPALKKGGDSMLGAIHHVAIIVSDYERSRAFYVDTLELPVIRENYREKQGNWKLDLRIGGCELEIFSGPNAPARPNYPEALGLRHLAFAVESVAETVQWLEAKGVACEPVRMDEITGKPMTFFKDPDGLPLEIHE